MSATVAIRRASGKRSVIDAATYDPATMTLWDAPAAAPAPEPMPTHAPAPEVKPTPRRGRAAGGKGRS